MIVPVPERHSNRRSALAGALLLSLALAAGCASNGVATAPGREADELPMIALEGYRDGERLYVSYRQGDAVFFAAGDWGERIELTTSADGGADAAPAIVALRQQGAGRWDPLPENAVGLPILGVDRWQQLRERMLRKMVAAGSGVVVDFGPLEFFLYRDRDGEFHAVRNADRPAGYPVRQRLPFDEFMRAGRSELDALLLEEGIERDEVLFNTGDSGLYSLPFLYLDRARGRAVFVRNEPRRAVAIQRTPGLKGGQAFGHVMRSHLSNLVLRPVSSLYRLFFVLTDTTIGTVRFDWAAALAEQPVAPLAQGPPMDLEEWERDLERIASRPPARGRVEALVDGEAYFSRLVETIEGAQRSISLQTYIFDNDDFAVEIGDLLKRRSREGIEVRVLLDGFGTITGTMTDSQTQPQHHEPPESVRLFLLADSEVRVRQKPNPWFTGDHVKSTVVDDRVAFVGGMNIGREYRYDWHDLMLEVRGPVVDSIRREFEESWAHAGPLGDLGYVIAKARPRTARAGGEGYPMRLLLTEPGNYEIFRAQYEAIRRARQYIYLQNAYFTNDQLLRELVLARRRGVDVRVIIPMETDHGPIGRSNILAANLMLAHGIRVYLYPGFSHVKAAIYDGWACVGSANFDRLSLRLNRELNLASSHPDFAGQLLEGLFLPDFALAAELTEPIPERWVDHLVEIVGDYLF